MVDQIIRNIKQFIVAVEHLPIQKELDVSPHWIELQASATKHILTCETALQVVHFGQRVQSGFDQRQTQNSIILDRVGKRQGVLKYIFGTDPVEIPGIYESKYSAPESLVRFKDRLFSTEVLWHAGFLLRILKLVEFPRLRVLEIGGGYGGLARLFSLSGRCAQYTIVDLAGSLPFSYAFLSLNFPERSIALCATPDDVARSQDFDFVLVPSQITETLKGRSFDVAINTASIQEMSGPSARHFVNFLQNNIDVTYFYSMNYIFEAKNLLNETKQGQKELANLATPELDSRWGISHFEINPLNVVVGSPRNYLEVLLKRTKEEVYEQGTSIDCIEYTSQEWFSRIWSELWRKPTTELIDLYLKGIKEFVFGKASVNANYSSKMVKLDPEILYNQIGEVVYWRNFRALLCEKEAAKNEASTPQAPGNI
jgi:putative sugar O-methyltransferase